MKRTLERLAALCRLNRQSLEIDRDGSMWVHGIRCSDASDVLRALYPHAKPDTWPAFAEDASHARDAQAMQLLDLAADLCSPEGYGHAIPREVVERASRIRRMAPPVTVAEILALVARLVSTATDMAHLDAAEGHQAQPAQAANDSTVAKRA